MSKMMEREEFEKWYMQKNPNCTINRIDSDATEFCGQYYLLSAQAGWEAWQARALLEKERNCMNKMTDEEILEIAGNFGNGHTYSNEDLISFARALLEKESAVKNLGKMLPRKFPLDDGDVESAASVVPGWKLVPIEPTPGMIEAGKDERMECFKYAKMDVGIALSRIYRAMLTAAPTEAKSEPTQKPPIAMQKAIELAQRRLSNYKTESSGPINDWPGGNYTNKCSGCSCLFTGPKNAPLCYVCMPKGEVDGE